MSLRVLLVGTHHPAVETTRRLVNEGLVGLLVMPPDAGDRNAPLLKMAKEHGVPTAFSLDDVAPSDFDVLVAANYPRLVPKRFTSALPCINTHWSLLPRHRGVHPTAWAIINEDETVGVTAHVMLDEFDTGPILGQRVLPLTVDTKLLELHERLGIEQAELVMEILEYLREHDTLPPTVEQDHAEATYVPQREPRDGQIDWSWPASRIAALTRVLPHPQYPSAFTHHEGARVRIVDASVAQTPAYVSTIGQVVRVTSDGGVWVKAGDGCVSVRTAMRDEDEEPRPAAEVLRRGMRLASDEDGRLESLRAALESLTRRVEELEAGHQ